MNFLLSLFLVLFAAAAALLFRHLISERRELRDKLDTAIEAKHQAEKQLELSEQKMADMELRMKDWQAQREESIKAAKAAILEAGGQMSNKLLEDHKREQEVNKKQQEEMLKKTTASMFEQFTSLTQTVATLHDKTQTTSQHVSNVLRALSNPSGAGQMAEAGLENMLKNLGLENKRDFIMQYSITDQESGNRLRPDAIVFLPQDVIIVVDSKASKFLLELGEVEGAEAQAATREKLRVTMQKHVRDLASKDYTQAVQQALKTHGGVQTVRAIFSVMYVPSESMLEHIKLADPDFMSKVQQAGLILAGPTSLHGLFSMARLEIFAARQNENHGKILEGISQVMESLTVMLNHFGKVGSAIKSAADAFNDATSSTNSRLIPRIEKLAAMGVKPAQGKELPKRLPHYDMQRKDAPQVIDLQAEYATDLVVANEDEQRN